MPSEAERVALMSAEQRTAWLIKNDKRLDKLDFDWSFWGRDDQFAPAGDWRTWFLMAGRGFGKTRAAAEWVRGIAAAHKDAHIALVAANHMEARSIMVEGESGLRSIGPWEERPLYEPSLRRLTWPNGAMATLYSAAEPDSLRGPNHSHGWADEIAKWDLAKDAWDNLGMTLRVGHQPRLVATTTPRPVPLVRRLLTEKGVAVTHGRMADNRAHLPDAWRSAMRGIYGGTRLGRQELDGELLADAENALWSRELIENCRVDETPDLTRVVIGVDPPASAHGDACGIIAAGLGRDGKAYVLGDHSVKGKSPEGWARAVAKAAERWQADRVIAEANQGGDMVLATLRAANVGLPVKKAFASRGKVARAEPVAALFEAGRAFFAGRFPELEDELCGLMIGGGYEGPGRSPDRADACVWALGVLLPVQREVEARVRLV